MMLSETLVLLLSSLRGPDPSVHVDVERLATAIADAAEETPLFGGERGVEKTAYMLVAIAHHESSLLERVRTCQVRGDGGAAAGLWQIHREWWGGHTQSEVCSSEALQASLAARALRYQVNRGVRSVPALMRAFASGNAATHSHQARELEATYRSVVLRAETAAP